MKSPVELTQDLVRFNTINPPGAERACAETLAALLKDGGFTGFRIKANGKGGLPFNATRRMIARTAVFG